MATNTFSSIREAKFWPRSPATYTFVQVMLPSNRLNDFRPPFTNGALAISGWVRDVGGNPQRRLLLLKIMPANEVIARTWSDQANMGNNYFFNGLQLLQAGETYTVEVHDPDGGAAPRIKDNLVPV